MQQKDGDQHHNTYLARYPFSTYLPMGRVVMVPKTTSSSFAWSCVSFSVSVRTVNFLTLCRTKNQRGELNTQHKNTKPPQPTSLVRILA